MEKSSSGGTWGRDWSTIKKLKTEAVTLALECKQQAKSQKLRCSQFTEFCIWGLQLHRRRSIQQDQRGCGTVCIVLLNIVPLSAAQKFPVQFPQVIAWPILTIASKF
jgi:hypothetical protein